MLLISVSDIINNMTVQIILVWVFIKHTLYYCNRSDIEVPITDANGGRIL